MHFVVANPFEIQFYGHPDLYHADQKHFSLSTKMNDWLNDTIKFGEKYQTNWVAQTINV